MADEVPVALEFWKEQCSQARHSEDQRATLANLVLLVAAADIGFVAQQKVRPGTVPLTVLLILLGLYGMAASAKYYERFRYHRAHAAAIRDHLIAEAGLDYRGQLVDRRQRHTEEFPRLERVRQNWLWLALHAAVALAGVILTVLAVV